ncbi:MAG TPA: alginate lyase family protein, partial [Gemmatimonadales bacterium]|nr:alginate lyase family protein [Gemmatimonadales bacterium]
APLLVPSPEMAAVRRALGRGRFQDAHAALSAHACTRPRRFLLHPSMRDALRVRITARHAAAAPDAARLADRIAAGEYHLLGYERLRFGRRAGDPDWHLDPVSGRHAPFVFWADVPYLDPACGDHKVIWELNRHQHWLALGRAWWLTGDPRYRRAFIAEAESWRRANPPLVGVNWASALELALRSLSWLWAIEFFAADAEPVESPWLVDLLLGLHLQLRQIERTLSRYFSPNTHLLGEALALYVAGRAWPELRRSTHWAALGAGILREESTRQVLSDGLHAERSPHYHRYALEFYLLALSVARVTGDAEQVAALAPVARRMAEALAALTDTEGRLPLIGDDDGGELCPVTGRAPSDVRSTLAWASGLLHVPNLAPLDVPEAADWLLASDETATTTPATPPVRKRPGTRTSVVLEASGYHVSRHGTSLLVFDAGAHGFLNGGHAHADALSVTLVAGGQPLLADPGTGTYTMDPLLRTRLRSSQWHNTLTLDGRSQSVPSGPFHWASTASAKPRRVVLNPRFDYFEAGTDAWAPAVHERAVLSLGEREWVVADRVLGTGRHEAAVHWHIAPEWAATRDVQGGVQLHHACGLRARLGVTGASIELHQGDRETGLGWMAPVYGRLVPATTVRCVVERAAPFWVISTIGLLDPNAPGAGSERLDVLATEPAGDAAALITRAGMHADVAMFRPTSTRRESATLLVDPRRGHAITTDARALFARIAEP